MPFFDTPLPIIFVFVSFTTHCEAKSIHHLMVAYRIAACLLWGVLSTSSASSSAAYRSLASNTVTVSSDSSETSVSVTVRCDNEVDSTINLYVVSEDDIAGVISFGDSVAEQKKVANEGCRRLNDATDPGDFDEGCRRLKDLTDPGLFDDGTPIYPNSTAFYMEKVNVPATESLQSANKGTESVFIAGQRFETGFITLMRTGHEIRGEVSKMNHHLTTNVMPTYV